MTWTPFEERPRPIALARTVLTLDRMHRIEITAENEDDIGEIFAWLMGQVALARREPYVFKGRGLGLEDDNA